MAKKQKKAAKQQMLPMHSGKKSPKPSRTSSQLTQDEVLGATILLIDEMMRDPRRDGEFVKLALARSLQYQLDVDTVPLNMRNRALTTLTAQGLISRPYKTRRGGGRYFDTYAVHPVCLETSVLDQYTSNATLHWSNAAVRRPKGVMPSQEPVASETVPAQPKPALPVLDSGGIGPDELARDLVNLMVESEQYENLAAYIIRRGDVNFCRSILARVAAYGASKR